MASTARLMGPARVVARRKPFVLPECVLNTMVEARTPSTRCLYALKLSIFSTWCQDRDLDLVTWSVVLSFMQGMLDKQHSSSTIKMYAAAIAAFNVPIYSRSVGRECGNPIFTRRQENESPTSSYSSALGLTNCTKGPKRAPV